MAIDTSDLKIIFNMFSEELKTLVTQIQTETNMEDEHFSSIVSQGIASAMDSSVRALQVYKSNELIDEQIDSQKERTTLIKEQTDTETQKAKLVEQDKNLRLEQIYTIKAKRKREQGATVDSDGVITYASDKSSQVENQIELLKKQTLKVIKDTTYIEKQGTNMDKQVKQNCIIQAMDKAEGYNMGIGNAGLIPSQDMHTNFFVQNKALMLEGGVTFDGNIAKLGDVTLGTFNIAASATESTT
jgi:predicted HNH restriction endonuclease